VPPSDDLDARLQAVAHLPPYRRLAAIWDSYTRATGCEIHDPPTDDERSAVQTWLRSNRDQTLIGHRERLSLRVLAGVSVLEKASTIVQLACPACEVVTDELGNIALHLSTAINVEPWSRQSKRGARKIREEVAREMRERGHTEPYERPVCVTVVSVVAAGRMRHRRMDADNLVKGLLDALNGVLYNDDSQIQCLTSRRLEYGGRRGHYQVSIRGVYEYGDDVVHDDKEAAVFAIGRPATGDEATQA